MQILVPPHPPVPCPRRGGEVIAAFAVGTIFALGLGVAGMTQPTKVIGFLDFFGTWDPTLLFVMMGAVGTYFVFFRVVRGTAPILTSAFQIPVNRQIDRRLVVGAAMFGVGWGLAGYCPGPALTSIATGAGDVLIFVTAMVAGMYFFAFGNRALQGLRRQS